MFHLAKHAAVLLDACRGTEIEPMPTEVKAETAELFKRATTGDVMNFLTNSMEPVARKDSLTFDELKTLVADHLKMDTSLYSR